MNIDWSKAPDWAACVIRAENDGDRLFWAEPWGTLDGMRQEIGRKRLKDEIADTSRKNGWSLVENRPGSMALHHQWCGRIYRLPPIGSTIRIDKGDRIIWQDAEIFIDVDVTLVATFKTRDTQMVVVEHPVEKQCCCFRADMVQTLEQIEAERRKDTISKMLRYAAITGESFRDVCGKLYDAGLRFEVKP